MPRPLRSVTLALTVLIALAARLPVMAQQCAGDCDADLVVGVDELVLCINVALGNTSVAECDACDQDQNEEVTVDELIAAVGSVLGVSLQGVCRVPCQGSECELPEATANGLVPCAAGTEVKVSRCTDRAGCLREETGRTAPSTGTVTSVGVFTVGIDGCQAGGSLFLLEADLSAIGGVTYRTLVSFTAGAAANPTGGRGRIIRLRDVVLDPGSEAAVLLLDEQGLENFTDEGVLEVIAAVAAANEDTQFSNQSPSAAADNAAEMADGDAGVQDAVMRGKIPTPTRTPVTPTRTPPGSDAEFEIGSATTAPNSLTTIGVTLNSALDAQVVGTLNDIGFEPGARIAEATKPMGMLAENISASDTAIALDDGSGIPPFGTVQIDDEIIAYGRIEGNVLVVGACVGGDAGIACVEDGECSGGGTCEPAGRGQSGTVASAHDAGTRIVPHRMPDCHTGAALEALNKNAVFSFLPPGCDPAVECDTIRAIVIALDNLSLLPTGETLLYTCRVQAGPAEGVFPLGCEDVQALGPPDGPGLVGATCLDGQVVVQHGVPTETPTPTPTRTSTTPTATPPGESSVAIDVGSVSGRPGETVRVDVTLRVSNAEVVATENRITVSPSTPILGCEIPSRFGFSQVILEPEGCDQNPKVDCLAAQVRIINPSLSAIEQGAVLYSCDIGISFIAQPESFPLVCSDQLASSPEGQPYNGTGRCREGVSMACDTDDDCVSVGGACRILPPTQCNNGLITVSDAPPLTPTPTEDLPTLPPTPTPTPSPSGTPDDALEIRIGSTALLPDAIGTFDVTLHVDAGHEASGALNDIFVAEGVRIPARMMAATLLSADIASEDTAIPVDDASGLPQFGLAQIDDEQVVYVRQDGNVLAAGSCSEGGGICADDAECGVGSTCDPTGRGQNETVPAPHAAGASVEIPTSVPDCTMSPELEALNKDALFSFLPAGCVPGIDCETLRAIVIGLSELSAFPAGDTVLYTCAVQAGAEEGTFPLECADAQVSGPPDEGLLDVACVDGEVFVLGAICGNGLLEEGEDCDDGSICLPSFQDCTDTGHCADGERCEPVGGDGCARNCTMETVRASSLDSEKSGALIGIGHPERYLHESSGLL